MFILTVRNDRLGDLILALPVMSALRERYPDARLGIVVSEGCRPLFDLYPVPVDVWTDDAEHRARLISDRPDAALFLYPDRTWTRAARKARIPVRIGTRYRWHSWMYTRRVPLHRRRSLYHEVECNLRIAEPLLGDVAMVPPGLRVTDSMRAEAMRITADAGIPQGRPYVVVHPGSRGSAWNWPPDYYRELIERLVRTGHTVVVTGGESERDICAHVAAARAADLSGLTSLATLAGILAQAAVMVSGSTGPMHLSAALETPVVVLFSPRPSHSPRRWGPLGPGHTVVMPDVASRRPEPDVMRTVTPDRVRDAVALTLRRREAVR